MSYKVTDEELEAAIDDWPATWWDPVSASEVSTRPPKDAPNDLVRRTDQRSHHDSNGKSSTETDPEAQRILKVIRSKR